MAPTRGSVTGQSVNNMKVNDKLQCADIYRWKKKDIKIEKTLDSLGKSVKSSNVLLTVSKSRIQKNV